MGPGGAPYSDGLVLLAHLLADPDLRETADGWVEAFVEVQDEHSHLGPMNHEYWPPYAAMRALYQHHQATGDEDALAAMREFCRFLYRTIDDRPLYPWAKYRWGGLAVSVHRLYEEGGEEWLLDLADEVAARGYDWRRHWDEFDLTEPVSAGDEQKGGGATALSRPATATTSSRTRWGLRFPRSAPATRVTPPTARPTGPPSRFSTATTGR